MKILADNLNRLIGPGKFFASNESAAAASGIGRSTIDRARKAEVSLRLDSLSDLAAAVHAQPWQLLVPDFDPKALPNLGAHPSDVKWPLPGISPEDFALIPKDEREEVLALAQSKATRHKTASQAMARKSNKAA